MFGIDNYDDAIKKSITDSGAYINLIIGGWYLRGLLEQFKGVIWKAAAAYNGGPGDVINGYLTMQSRTYYIPIMYYFNFYGEDFPRIDIIEY